MISSPHADSEGRRTLRPRPLGFMARNAFVARHAYFIAGTGSVDEPESASGTWVNSP